MTTDRQLVARSLRGDSDAFAEFYDRHSASVLRYAFALSRDSDDAQDLLQETFVTAWDKLGDIRIGTSSALPWLLVTCRNKAQNLRRSNEIRATVPFDETRDPHRPDRSDDTLERLAREEELRWVFAAIDVADPTDRRIIEACIVEGMPYREAAHHFGLSEQAIAKRVSRLRSRLSGLRAVRQGAAS
jgi:RNA polymerase sigma factor (sigma-70 family)